MRFIVLFLLVIHSAQAMSKAPADTIGVRTFEYQDTTRKRPVVTELWYPTQEKGTIDSPADLAWVHPKEIRNAKVADGVYPLIIMSHGHGGDRRDRSWLAEHLVKNGFIVASVDHYGNSWKSYDPVLSLRFWERALDVTFALNQLLKHTELNIDRNRIGFVGYSLGGMTGLSLAGAKAKNLEQVLLDQQKQLPEIDPKLMEQFDLSEAYHSFVDSRIKAFALLSPALFVFNSASLQDLQVPVAMVTSKGDEILPFHEHAALLMSYSALNLKMLRDQASHYVYLNRVSPAGKEMLAKEIHTKEIEADRLSVHKEISSFLVNFFKEQFKTRKE